MLVLPEWISNLIEQALRNHFSNANVQILGHKSSPAIPVGENYTTDIFRTSITYTADKSGKKDTISVIVKSCPPSELLSNYAKLMGLFEQEIAVYTEVLPTMSSLLGDGSETFSAKCISFITEPNSAIILEDLTTMGFKMYPRLKGLNLQHCLLAIEKLAYFHAASAVILEKSPSLVNHYQRGIYWDNPFTRRWITFGFATLTEACSKWPGCEKYSRKLKSIEHNVFERTLSAGRLQPEDFSVLNHGDFWSNNFMFSYSPDEKLKDCRLLDFQVAFHSSPAIDLNYFWATTPNIEVRNQHMHTILEHYYEKLVATLSRLQYPPTKLPSRVQFREDLNNRAFYGLAASVTVLPIIAASTRDDASFENLFENEEEDGFRHDAYNNERYRRYMEYLLPLYDSLGILD